MLPPHPAHAPLPAASAPSSVELRLRTSLADNEDGVLWKDIPRAQQTQRPDKTSVLVPRLVVKSQQPAQMPHRSLSRGWKGAGGQPTQTREKPQRHSHVKGIHTRCVKSRWFIRTNALTLRCKGKQMFMCGGGETIHDSVRLGPEHSALPLQAWWKLPHVLASTGQQIVFAGTPPFPTLHGSRGRPWGAHGHSRCAQLL